MLVLSQTGQVWFCGPAVEELLGWKDEEVTDVNFCDIMNRKSLLIALPKLILM